MARHLPGNKGLRDGLNGNPGPYVPASQMTTTPNRPTGGKKDLLPSLTCKEQGALDRVQRLGYQLDKSFGEFCGMQIGWSSVIAMVPGIGDMLDMLLALMVFRTACEADLPMSVKFRMLSNIAFDFVIGLVPFIGDVMDIGFKANSRNADLLESVLLERVAENAARRIPHYQPPGSAQFFEQGIHNDVEAQRPFPRVVLMSAKEKDTKQQGSRVKTGWQWSCWNA